MGILWHFVA